MIWWQSQCKFGDMIRISFGNYCHYGIFVSEDEVIQFGMPPTEGLLNRDNSTISVCVSDIDAFACGKIVEVASVQKGDKLKRLAPKKTVKLAREMLGHKGYDVMKNNCEHFARYCYFGEKMGDVTQSQQSKNKKGTYVFLSRIPESLEIGELFPKSRKDEVASINNEKVKNEKYWAWKTLENALDYAFGYKLNQLNVQKNECGKWTCDKCCFSISHSDGVVVVAVSNREIGVDIESLSRFENKFLDEQKFNNFVDKIVAKKETRPTTIKELTLLWVKKESAFKYKGENAFVPNAINTKGNKFLIESACAQDKEYVFSVCGQNLDDCKYFVFDGKTTMKFEGQI